MILQTMWRVTKSPCRYLCVENYKKQAVYPEKRKKDLIVVIRAMHDSLASAKDSHSTNDTKR